MRRFTLISDKTMDFVQIGCEDEAELFEEFFRETYPNCGLASFWLGSPSEPVVRTDEEEERVRDLMTEFAAWKSKQ